MKPVYIQQAERTSKRSKAQARYEKLLSEIQQLQQFVSNVREGVFKAQGKIRLELQPLEHEHRLLSRDYIIRLNELAATIGLSKFNQEWFEAFIRDQVETLLDFFGYQDKTLAAIYEKYTGMTADDIAEDDDLQELAESLSAMLGFKVDVKELLEKGEKAYIEEYQYKIQDNFRERASFSTEDDSTQTKQGGQKSKNKKSGDEDASLAKDARNVYMRLVKRYHPDLEKDPVIQHQNSEIIKQVTKAYQENDFFTLLKLQVAHLDENEAAAETADDMIKRYNKILQKQLDELKNKMHELHFAGGDVIENFIDKNGKFSPQKFTAGRRTIEKEIAQIKASLADSKKRPKSWFKEHIQSIKSDMQQQMMENMLDEMFDDFEY